MIQDKSEAALPVELFIPRRARPRYGPVFVRWVRSFSVRTGILVGLLVGSAFLFAALRSPWVCTAELPIGSWAGIRDLGQVVAFSPDGSRMLLGTNDGATVLYDSQTGRQLARHMNGSGAVHRVAWSPDGRWIASVNRMADGRDHVCVWDAAGGEEKLHVGTADGVRRIEFSADGGQFRIVRATGVLETDELPSGAWLRRWSVHQGLPDQTVAIDDARFSPDGAWAVAWSGGGQFLFVHDAREGRQVRFRATQFLDVKGASTEPGYFLRDRPHQIRGIRFSPDGSRFATIEQDGLVFVWETATGDPVLEIATGWPYAEVWDARFNADGGELVTFKPGDAIRRWDARTGRRLGEKKVGPGDPLAWSSDGRRILYSRWGNWWDSGAVVDADSGLPEAGLGWHRDGANRGAFSQDGGRALTIGWDGTCRLWQRRWDGTPVGVFGQWTFWLMAVLAFAVVFSVLRDMRRTAPPWPGGRPPFSLRAAAYTFGLLAGVCLIDVLGLCCSGEWRVQPQIFLTVPLGVLSLLIGIGLLRRNRVWRLVGMSLWAGGLLAAFVVGFREQVGEVLFNDRPDLGPPVGPLFLWMLGFGALAAAAGLGRRAFRDRVLGGVMAGVLWAAMGCLMYGLASRPPHVSALFGWGPRTFFIEQVGCWVLYGLPAAVPEAVQNAVIPLLLSLAIWQLAILAAGPRLREAFRRGPAPRRWARWRRVGRWVTGFSVRSAVLAALLVGSGVLFAYFKDPWICATEIPIVGSYKGFSLTPDGRCAVVLTGREGAVYDVATGRLAGRLSRREAAASVRRVLVSMDGRRAAVHVHSAGDDPTEKLYLYDLQTGDGRLIARGEGDSLLLAFSPDGTRILGSPQPGFIELWETATGRSLGRLKAHERSKKQFQGYGADGELEEIDGGAFLAGDETVLVWTPSAVLAVDLTGGPTTGPARDFPPQPVSPWSVHPRCLVAPDGRSFVTCDPNGALCVWSARTMQCSRTLSHATSPSTYISAIHFSPDGRRVYCLAYTYGDGQFVDTWDADSGQCIAHTPTGFTTVYDFLYSPGVRHPMLIAADNLGAYVVDTDSGLATGRVALRSEWLSAVCYSAATGRIVAADRSESVVRIWQQRWPGSPAGVLANPTFWLMVVLAAGLAWSVLRDTKRRRGREAVAALPRQVRVAAYGFGLLGALGLIAVVGGCSAGAWMLIPPRREPVFWVAALINWVPAALLAACLPLAVGLLQHNRGWRHFGIVWTWLFVAALLVPVGLEVRLALANETVPPTRLLLLFGQPLTLPAAAMLSLAPVALAGMVFQLHALHGKSTRRAFRRRRGLPLGEPAPDAAVPVSLPAGGVRS